MIVDRVDALKAKPQGERNRDEAILAHLFATGYYLVDKRLREDTIRAALRFGQEQPLQQGGIGLPDGQEQRGEMPGVGRGAFLFREQVQSLCFRVGRADAQRLARRSRVRAIGFRRFGIGEFVVVQVIALRA